MKHHPDTIIYQLVKHPLPKMEKLAKSMGWAEADSIFDYVEPEFYDEQSEYTTLGAASEEAIKYLKEVGDVFGCCQIFKLRYEEDDDMPGHYEWTTLRTYEVGENGITSDW